MNTCDTCKFGLPHTTYQGSNVFEGIECHRYPPQLGKYRSAFTHDWREWPVMGKAEWCGEYQQASDGPS